MKKPHTRIGSFLLVFALILTLCLATPVAADLRYAYPLILSMPLLLCAGLEIPEKAACLTVCDNHPIINAALQNGKCLRLKAEAIIVIKTNERSKEAPQGKDKPFGGVRQRINLPAVLHT